MNSYQRVMARLKGGPVDRIPNLCILMGLAARSAGVPYRDFCLKPEAMVEANVRYHEDFGIDVVTVMSDAYGEAFDYGLKVDFPEDSLPLPQMPFWAGEPTVESLPLRDIESTTRMKARAEAVRLYAARLKGECPIVGWVEGPFAEYCDLRGVNDAMLDLAEGEDFLHPVLQRLCDQAVHYALAQLDAGADIIGIGDAVCSMVGPQLYRENALPYERQLAKAIHDKGGLVKLHICGNITPLLEDINALAPDILDVDWMVDFAGACKAVPNAACNGNFDPVAVALQGTAEDVRRAVRRCAAEGDGRAMVSGGCEIPIGTPAENLAAVTSTLWERANEQ